MKLDFQAPQSPGNLSGLVSLLFALSLGSGIVLFFDSPPSTVAASRAEQRTIQSGAGARTDIHSSNVITYYLYLPVAARGRTCPALPGESYGTVAPISSPTNPPAENHPDLNLALRGYTNTVAYLGLIDLEGHIDLNSPQLPGLFTDNRTAIFSAADQVYNWDWNCNCRAAPIADPPVTLAKLATSNGETIHVPSSGYDIGKLPNGYAVMVLYASTNRLTLKYTREDNVILGYTLHLENVCVEPNLLALYQSLNASGRTRLPALYAGQGVGTAVDNELGVAIRDTGAFMDPRSRKDWWQGR